MVATVQGWNQRKGRLFTRVHIERAWNTANQRVETRLGGDHFNARKG